MVQQEIEIDRARFVIAELGDASRARMRAACTRLLNALGDDEVADSRSHSHGWVAVGRGPQVGVDIEVARSRERLAEMAQLIDLPATDEASFYAHWTLREAIAKCVDGSVLVPEPIEDDLLDAARHPGQLVRAGAFVALVAGAEVDVGDFFDAFDQGCCFFVFVYDDCHILFRF